MNYFKNFDFVCDIFKNESWEFWILRVYLVDYDFSYYLED